MPNKRRHEWHLVFKEILWKIESESEDGEQLFAEVNDSITEEIVLKVVSKAGNIICTAYQ